MTTEQEQVLQGPVPFDPREFTNAEWSVIRQALQASARQHFWKAAHRDTENGRAESMAAAERRKEIARKSLNAAIYCRDLRSTSASADL